MHMQTYTGRNMYKWKEIFYKNKEISETERIFSVQHTLYAKIATLFIVWFAYYIFYAYYM